MNEQYHDADHLLRLMQDAGVDVTATVMGPRVVVNATDQDDQHQQYTVRRDDGDLRLDTPSQNLSALVICFESLGEIWLG